jgi:hypothetical protein
MRLATRALLLAATVLAAGCGGGPAPSTSPSAPPPSVALAAAGTSSPSAQPSPVPSAVPSASASAAESAAPSAAPAASPGSGVLDPCSLLTADEASQVNGASYGAGVAHPLQASAFPGLETTAPASAECVWQQPGHASVTLQVVADASPAAASARLGALKSGLKTFAISDLASFADGAFIARTTSSLSTGGIYVVTGSTLFDIVYLQGSAPDDAALQHWAILVLGSLP